MPSLTAIPSFASTQPTPTAGGNIKPERTTSLPRFAGKPEKTKDSVSISRFGDPKAKSTSPTWPERGKAAVKNMFNPWQLFWDGVIGTVCSIVSFLIPPHAHAFLMIPAAFAIGMTYRGITAAISPDKYLKKDSPQPQGNR